MHLVQAQLDKLGSHLTVYPSSGCVPKKMTSRLFGGSWWPCLFLNNEVYYYLVQSMTPFKYYSTRFIQHIRYSRKFQLHSLKSRAVFEYAVTCGCKFLVLGKLSALPYPHKFLEAYSLGPSVLRISELFHNVYTIQQLFKTTTLLQ